MIMLVGEQIIRYIVKLVKPNFVNFQPKTLKLCIQFLIKDLQNKFSVNGIKTLKNFVCILAVMTSS